MYQLNSSVLDPVLAYEKYMSKLNPGNNSLFQKPKRNFVFEEDSWYTKEVLGKKTLSGIMKCLSQKAGLSHIYTNHCVRASTVTTLYRAGIDTQQICAITKHRNESTLSHYITSASELQKQQASHILSAAIAGSVESGSDVESEVKATEKKTVVDVSKSKSSNLLQNIMSNATFQNCTINFYGQSSQM